MLREELVIQNVLMEHKSSVLQMMAANLSPLLARVTGKQAEGVRTFLDNLAQQAADLRYSRFKNDASYAADRIRSDVGSYQNLIRLYESLVAAKVFDRLHNFGKDRKASKS